MNDLDLAWTFSSSISKGKYQEALDSIALFMEKEEIPFTIHEGNYLIKDNKDHAFMVLPKYENITNPRKKKLKYSLKPRTKESYNNFSSILLIMKYFLKEDVKLNVWNLYFSLIEPAWNRCMTHVQDIMPLPEGFGTNCDKDKRKRLFLDGSILVEKYLEVKYSPLINRNKFLNILDT